MPWSVLEPRNTIFVLWVFPDNSNVRKSTKLDGTINALKDKRSLTEGLNQMLIDKNETSTDKWNAFFIEDIA